MGWISRSVAFSQADQWVDLALYDAALREGRVVLAVRMTRGADRQRAVEVLQRGGAHFLNYYGGMVTEDISAWRGERPNLPSIYQR